MIDQALEEDLPNGDLTTDALGIKETLGTIKIIAKEDLILSGSDPFEKTVLRLDPSAEFRWQFYDGDHILNRQIVCLITGNLIQILKAERTALNFLGKLSGIASLTRCYVEALGDSKTKILDTRKTQPLYRELEKKAVVDGGGKNHRINLSDGILIKENHIRAVGNFEKTILRVREATDLPIEVETTDLDEVRKAVELRVDRIMLDNMSNTQMERALEIIPKQIETEASGNMNIERIKQIKDIGLDFISVGAITHSAPCADFSMIFEWSGSER
jgi:nicotinate-nucleotide pyrophosphorylase (carboxylating)